MTPTPINVEERLFFYTDKFETKTTIPLGKFVKEFNEVRTAMFGGLDKRQSFLWYWVLMSLTTTALCEKGKKNSYSEYVNEVKLLGVIFDVLLDDIADQYGDTKTAAILLKEIEKACYQKPYNLKMVTVAEREYALFCVKVWETIFKYLQQLPSYRFYNEMMMRKYKKLFEVMTYSLEIRVDPESVDYKKYHRLLSHNMHMIINGLMDLMSMKTKYEGIGLKKIVQILLLGQKMGRIGNAVTTYERELFVKDFSSDVIAFALKKGVLTKKDFNDVEMLTDKIKAKQEYLEGFFWSKWLRLRNQLIKHENDFDHLDIKGYRQGLETLKQFHLASRGNK